jgi:tetratricopeptide (TPR) repeat protein
LIEHYLVRPVGEGFLFAHALVQEGVYGSLLRTRRRELHMRAADWFADRDPVLRAEHLDRAEDPAAPGAYFEAARMQVAEYHFERALQLAGRGYELATERAAKFELACFRADILRDLGTIEESIAAFRSALETSGDDVERCRALIGLAAGMRVTDEYDDALATLDAAEAAATDNGLGAALAEIHYLRGNIFFPLSNIDGCLAEHGPRPASL